MKFTNELQIHQIKELIYLELRKYNIAMSDDEFLLDDILDDSARIIIAINGQAKDPREVLDWIDSWITDTMKSQPGYFIERNHF